MSYNRISGLGVARSAIALHRGVGFSADSVGWAERTYGAASGAAALTRASVGTTIPGSPGWGAEFAEIQAESAAFIGLVEQEAVPLRLPARRVPLQTPIIIQENPGEAEWIGEGVEIPATSQDFSRATIPAKKLAALAVFTRELMDQATLDAEIIIRDGLVQACTASLNSTFLDPANTGTGVKPASITAAAPVIAGTSDDIRDALVEAAELFSGDLEAAWWVARPSTYLALAGADHPAIGLRGGELLGAPAIASSALPAIETSPPVGDLVLVDPSGIALGVGTVAVQIAQQAAVMINGQLVDLWSNGLVGCRVILDVNWQVVRPAAIVRISGIGV